MKKLNFLLNPNFVRKMCSFEVHCIDVAKKLREWEGGKYCTFCYIAPSISTTDSEQHKHDITQKDTFSM